MCKVLRYVLMLALFPVSVIGQTDQVIYAITAADKGSNDWVALRTLNMRSGKLSQMLLNMNDRGLLQYDMATHKLKDKIASPVLAFSIVASSFWSNSAIFLSRCGRAV